MGYTAPANAKAHHGASLGRFSEHIFTRRPLMYPERPTLPLILSDKWKSRLKFLKNQEYQNLIIQCHISALTFAAAEPMLYFVECQNKAHGSLMLPVLEAWHIYNFESELNHLLLLQLECAHFKIIARTYHLLLDITKAHKYHSATKWRSISISILCWRATIAITSHRAPGAVGHNSLSMWFVHIRRIPAK